MIKKTTKYLILIYFISINFSIYANFDDNDTLYFKANYDYPPYQFFDENLNPTGFSIDILNAISKTMGLNINIELDNWTQVRQDLDNKKIDAVLGMSSSLERSKTINFSAPYIYITHSLFVRNGSDIETINNIKNKQVLVIKDDIMHDHLISNNITEYIIPVKNYKTALRLLSAGEYDCALINKLHGQFAIKEFNLSNLKPVGKTIQTREVCIAVIKGREDLLAQINDGLQIIESTGEYDQILKKWFGLYEKSDITARVLRIIMWILVPFFLILFSALIWLWTLRKQVSVKTSELQNELNERKKAEKLLIQEKSLLNSMINAIPDLIFYKNKDNIYIGCNDAFCKFNNKLAADIIGKDDFKVFPEIEAKKYFETDSKIIYGNKIIRTESWETNKNGERFLLDTLKVPFSDDEGNPLGIVGICHDITSRFKNEIDLKKAKEQAEESDKLKSSFLANMSHEIRTPMNAIIGFSDLLVDADTEGDEREELVTHINNNCNTLLHLIDDIIDLAKIETNELTVFIKDTDINSILNELLDSFNKTKNKIGKGLIDIKMDTSSFKDNFYLQTDSNRLIQIISNLINNALKYTEKGFIKIGYKILYDLKVVEFSIQDTGIGIAKDKQQEIFQHFKKIESDNSKLYRGTGLGLTITQNLIEKLGGEIRVESEINKGSTFNFTLPLKFAENKIENYEKKNIIHDYEIWKNKTILVAEDENSNYKYLELILSNKGIKLLRAENGFEAVEICEKKKKIDLILMDIKMPGMNGLEATTRIKKIKPNIPIIIQTAYAMQNNEKESFNAGCDDYISKPIKKEKLISILERWLIRS
ncbi:MAG: transporter substrate-binding domain-containing protein [Bacteroidales bacterium]|jgi:PAS domain S-box-containing protein|nr:transporter substrate-binding domain-containing protein [Bacteroidales bacterium]